MTNPLLSIVVPTKNRYMYLEEMIRMFVSTGKYRIGCTR